MVGAERYRQALGAALAVCLLAVAVGLAAAPAPGAPLDDLLPHLHTSLTATPAPIPAPSEGRIPVSLRLAESIWTDDGSHPSAATEVRFELDRQLQFDLSGVPRCPSTPIQSYPRSDWGSCKPAIVAGGRIKWEIALPEQEAFRTGAEAIAYRANRNKLLIRTHVPAPINAEVVISVELSPTSEGRYGLSATASIPMVAGGSGSLTYLGLRFRKGLFSAACPKRRLQSRVTDTFADGTRADGGLIITC
jgi:hypothetical protein